MKTWILDLITVLGFLLTALGTYLTMESGVDADTLLNPIFIGLGVLAFVTTVGWYHYFQKSKLQKSVLLSHNDFSDSYKLIHHLNLNPKNATHIQQGIKSLSEICQNFAACLRKYHSPDISVCIQYVNKDENGAYYVKELTRNVEGNNHQTKRPPAAFNKDYLSENSDFNCILFLLKAKHMDKIYYKNNFLPYSPYYRNSHFSFEMRDKYYATSGILYRIFSWELPYKSTLVVPLVTVLDNKERRLEGFLSIDSPKLRSFSKEYDLPLVLHYARMLTPVVAAYNASNLLSK